MANRNATLLFVKVSKAESFTLGFFHSRESAVVFSIPEGRLFSPNTGMMLLHQVWLIANHIHHFAPLVHHIHFTISSTEDSHLELMYNCHAQYLIYIASQETPCPLCLSLLCLSQIVKGLNVMFFQFKTCLHTQHRSRHAWLQTAEGLLLINVV